MDACEFMAGITSWLPFSPAGPRIVLQCHTSPLTRAFLNGDTDVARHMGRFKSWAVRNLSKAHGILACSSEIAFLEAGCFHVHPDRITILPHAFDRRAEDGFALKSAPVKDGSFLVVGNVEYFKALDLVAAGFERYLQQGGRGRLLVAGCGGLHELWRKATVGAIKPIVERVLREHGKESIQFLGSISKDELARLRTKATAVICGSRFEAFSMVTGEAFLSHCPVILSERSGWRVLAERFQAAPLVDPYQPDEIAAAMFALESPTTRETYLKGGDALAAYLQSPELAEETTDFYRRVTKGKS